MRPVWWQDRRMGYLPEMWRDFGVSVAGLAGALTGLLFPREIPGGVGGGQGCLVGAPARATRSDRDGADTNP